MAAESSVSAAGCPLDTLKGTVFQYSALTLPHPPQNRCKIPLPEQPKPSRLQMQFITIGKHACKSFSHFGLWSNPASLAGCPRLIAWKGRHASAGEVTSATEAWVCFSLQLGPIAFLTQQQVAQHGLLPCCSASTKRQFIASSHQSVLFHNTKSPPGCL